VSDLDFNIHHNVAEYVLFMWQTEDLARACGLDTDAVMEIIRAGNGLPPEKEEQLRQWYDGIIKKMKAEQIEKSGHLSEVTELQMELFYLHTTLLTVLNDQKYIEMIAIAKPAIDEYRSRSDVAHGNDIDICLHALYMKILLKLRGVAISQATEDAMQAFTKIMAYLSQKYKLMKEGKMNFSLN
jgi:hypothetical protein